MHGGFYGRGTYVSCNWRTGLFFGPVLFRIELQAGTCLVQIDLPPDGKVLDSMKREFGKEILTKSPWKVMPSNKRLTLDQAIQLPRYHVTRFEGEPWGDARSQRHEKQMFDMHNILVRYGIQGWGQPSDLSGIVVFATDRLKASEVVLSLLTDELWSACQHPNFRTGNDVSLDAMTRRCRSAGNRGAANSLRWVEAANASLRGELQSMKSRPVNFIHKFPPEKQRLNTNIKSHLLTANLINKERQSPDCRPQGSLFPFMTLTTEADLTDSTIADSITGHICGSGLSSHPSIRRNHSAQAAQAAQALMSRFDIPRI
jgi:hypothetical protein